MTDHSICIGEDNKAVFQLQSKLSPSAIPVIDNLKLSYRLLPSQAAGGDFLDFIRIADGRLLFFLCDVSGHDVGAAMIAYSLKLSIQQYLATNELTVNLQDFLQCIHSTLRKMNNSYYATAVVGIYDSNTRELCYSVAGHWPPPLLKTESGVRQLPGQGMPVGLYSEIDIENHSLSLPENFTLVISSDGLLEHLRQLSSASSDQAVGILSDMVQTTDRSEGIYAQLQLDSHGDKSDDIAVLVIASGTESNGQDF